MTTPGSDQPAFGEGDPGSMPPPPSQEPGAGWSGSGMPGVAAPRNGFGITALVLGILAIVLCWSAIGGIVLGALAIIFAILGMRRASQGVATNRGMSIAGLVTGIIGLIVGVLFAILVGSVLSVFGNQFKDLQQCLQQAGGDQAKIQACDQQFQQQIQQQQGNNGG